jgi:ribosome-binding factor A
MSRRTERLASTIRQELATIIQREVDDPRIKMLPAITRVEVAEDLSVAKVYVSIMGTPGAQTAALNALKHGAGMMRTRLAKMLTIRQMPFLAFFIDEGHRKELEILETLHKLELERQAREAAKVHHGATEAPSEDEAQARPESQG